MKKYINIMMVLMFASMACDVEDEIVSALTPEVNSAYVGTWLQTHQQSNSEVDCSGTWSDDANTPIDTTIGYTLGADGVMTSVGTDSAMTTTALYTSSGTTGTVFGQDVLTFEEQSDGTWVMWYKVEAPGVYCNRSGYTMQ